jgi:3-oxoacyl-[acyl-carrier protein] reductase
MNSLKNKKVLITGGASGIGKAITIELANLGADIYIHYFSSKNSALELVQMIESRGQRAFSFQADLTNTLEIKKMFEDIKEKFSALDILVNNSGELVGRINTVDFNYESYRKIMSVNFDSMFFVTIESIPFLRNSQGSSIINISSIAGRNGGGKGTLAYSSAKGAAVVLTRHLAKELSEYGIRVNAVCPGLILGSRFHEIHTTKEMQENTIKSIPLKRAGTCEDVARAVSFLASEYNGFISGATLDINGGSYMA